MDPESAWLAGLLEGEGHFRTHTAPSGQLLPSVQLKMTDRDIVERFAVLTGGRVAVKPSRNLNHSEAYECTLKGSSAARVMRQILPFMGRRRAARIRELLTECRI